MRLVPANDPALKTFCRPVTPEELPALRPQTAEIRDLMLRRKGCGLAAPQFGDTRRYFCWKAGLVINPGLLSGEGSEISEEGCLSYPGIRRKLRRFRTVDVIYQDTSGASHRKTLTGLEARIFQHALDHLNGLCKVSPDYKGQ